MKFRIVLALMSAVVLTGNASAAREVMPKRAKSFFANRRICVSRDTATLPGYVITRWERNGKPDTRGPAVVTNALRAVVGVEQKNSLHVRLKEAQVDAEVIRDIRKRALKAQKNLDKLLKVLYQVLDKAASDDEAALYKALIDLLLVTEE